MSSDVDPNVSSILTPEEIEKFSSKYPDLAEAAESEEKSTEEGAEKELTEEEKRELYVKQLKESKIKFRNVTQKGNKTTVKFNAAYKQERKRKNKQQRKSRKKNKK
ncbi:MAG: hypothetical protein WC333_01835 [Dehalococcoidia bacterium]|jgi:vacuolar-type H+-ATPase subunit I/STV1